MRLCPLPPLLIPFLPSLFFVVPSLCPPSFSLSLLAFLSCPLPPTLLITYDREAQARRGLLLYTGSPAGRAAIPKEVEVGAGLTDAQVDEVAAYVMRILSAPEVSRSFDIERFPLPP